MTVDEIKVRLRLRDVLAQAGSVEDKPGWWKCPLHPSQATGSFHLRDNDTKWKCFSCDGGGDALDLVAALRNVPLATAIAQLSDEYSTLGTPTRTAVRRFDPPEQAGGGGSMIDVADLWKRSVAYGAETPTTGAAIYFLVKRFSAMWAMSLLSQRAVGILPPPDALDGWLRMRSIEGYRIAVPLYGAPLAEDTRERPAPADLILRWADGCGKRPEDAAKALRLPRVARGRTVFFGWLPEAIENADGGDLWIAEGWADYLTLECSAGALRAMGNRKSGVIGLASCSTAKKSAPLIAAEIEAARVLGRKGPARIHLCPQNDQPSRDGMKLVAAGLGQIATSAGVVMGIAEPAREKKA